MALARLAAFAGLALLQLGVHAYNELDQFLIVSSSATHQIAYAPIPQNAMPGQLTLKTLITNGLTYPQGLAVDPWRRYLYVADPTLNQLVYYILYPSGAYRLDVSKQYVAANDVEVRWVSVDSLGNVYFTVESTQMVMRITADQLDRADTRPQVVFEGAKSPFVSAPGGIAIDNYFAYWTNKLDPAKAGTLVRSLHAPGSNTTLISDINVKCYGVCTAVNNVFFTAEAKNIYGISRLGGTQPVTVANSFEEARGCAWDGENTVYVADKKKNAVFSFPANMQSLHESLPISLTAYMEGAYGVVVYTVSQSAGSWKLSPGMFGALLPSLIALSLWQDE